MTEHDEKLQSATDLLVHKPLTRDMSNLQINDELKEVGKLYEANGTEEPLKEIYKSMLAKNPNAKCPSCGGKPLKSKICGVCNAGSISKDIDIIDTLTEEETDRLLIPKKYKTEKFNSDILKSDYNHLMIEDREKISFSIYTKILDSILTRISNHKLEKSSLYISAPSGMGKETFAYSLLQLAKSKGMTVFPYLDLLEVRRFIEAFELHNFKDPIIESVGFKDVDLYNAEVCVLKVPTTQSEEGFHQAYKTMLQVIDRRARKDLPTIILSREYARYFFAYDKMNQVAGIIKYNNPSPKNLQVYEVTYRRKGRQDYGQDGQ